MGQPLSPWDLPSLTAREHTVRGWGPPCILPSGSGLLHSLSIYGVLHSFPARVGAPRDTSRDNKYPLILQNLELATRFIRALVARNSNPSYPMGRIKRIY